MLLVDHTLEKNQGVYKVGKNLDSQGVPTGDWGGWWEIPDWFSWQNQGGGIAIGSLERPNSHDLIAFGIDAPTEQNVGMYCVVVLDSVRSVQG